MKRKLIISFHYRHVVNAFTLVYEIGACCIYVVFMASNFKELSDYFLDTKTDIRLIMLIMLMPLILINWVGFCYQYTLFVYIKVFFFDEIYQDIVTWFIIKIIVDRFILEVKRIHCQLTRQSPWGFMEYSVRFTNNSHKFVACDCYDIGSKTNKRKLYDWNVKIATNFISNSEYSISWFLLTVAAPVT